MIKDDLGNYIRQQRYPTFTAIPPMIYTTRNYVALLRCRTHANTCQDSSRGRIVTCICSVLCDDYLGRPTGGKGGEITLAHRNPVNGSMVCYSEKKKKIKIRSAATAGSKREF